MGGGISDYLDVVVEPGYEGYAAAELFRTVLESPDDWNVLDLTDLPRQSLLLNLPAVQHSVREHDTCSVLRLPSTEEQLLQVFSKRQRANLRNAHSRLQRAGGGSIETATAENVSEFLNDLFALHTTRWSGRGEPGVLADERIRKFHLTCAPELLKDGILHLSRLRLGSRTLAIIYSLFSQETAFCYLQGFDPEFASLSPGTQLMYSVIHDALNGGMREFDFLRGKEDYKQHWRPERRLTYRIQIARRVLAGGSDATRATAR
jgi:CelD/BcsL family acetyltransferase involved in cellulose biosynthesis